MSSPVCSRSLSLRAGHELVSTVTDWLNCGTVAQLLVRTSAMRRPTGPIGRDSLSSGPPADSGGVSRGAGCGTRMTGAGVSGLDGTGSGGTGCCRSGPGTSVEAARTASSVTRPERRSGSRARRSTPDSLASARVRGIARTTESSGADSAARSTTGPGALSGAVSTSPPTKASISASVGSSPGSAMTARTAPTRRSAPSSTSLLTRVPSTVASTPVVTFSVSTS